jgi:hypothetical protein
MKKTLLLIVALLFLPFTVQAQFKIGIRAGLSTSSLHRETIEEGSLKLAIDEAKYGIHFGVFARGYFSENFYLQPEILFNSNRVDFVIDDHGDGLVNKILNEKYRYLDIPLMFGYKLGSMRLEAGPVGHAYLASKTELDEITGYEQRFNDFTVGYQAGFGLDIWKILIDIRYEGNFEDFGEHMYIGDKQINFSQSPNRWVMTVGYAF